MARLRELTTPKSNRYIAQVPHPRQAAFMLLPQREVLYGGAAGGGKSSALLAAALQYFDVPGYSALILRTSRAALKLPDGLIPRSHAWLAHTGAKWSEQDKTWTSPEGATLTFGYLEGPRDSMRYASSAYQFIGFEELTEFKREEDYRFLFSRLRRPASLRVPLRMRATTNPIGPGYQWVKERFVVQPPTAARCYLPSRLEDNPSLDAEAYELALAELGPVVAAKLRHGDWTVMQAGEMFRREDYAIVSEAPRLEGRIVRRWDLAASEVTEATPDPDWTVGVKMGRTRDGAPVVLDVRRVRVGPEGVDRLLMQTAREDGRDVAIVVPQDPGQAGKSQLAYYVRMLAGWDISGELESANKVLRAGPWSAQSRAGRVILVRGPWLSAYLDEHEVFPYGPHDDQVDASAGAFNFLTAAPTPLRMSATPVIR